MKDPMNVLQQAVNGASARSVILTNTSELIKEIGIQFASTVMSCFLRQDLSNIMRNIAKERNYFKYKKINLNQRVIDRKIRYFGIYTEV